MDHSRFVLSSRHALPNGSFSWPRVPGEGLLPFSSTDSIGHEAASRPFSSNHLMDCFFTNFHAESWSAPLMMKETAGVLALEG
jgi:hypothetical protein